MGQVTEQNRVEVVVRVPFVAGKQRPHFAGGRAYTPEATRVREREIWAAYVRASEEAHGRLVRAPRGTPVDVLVGVAGPLPKGRPRGVGSEPFTVRPDADNVLKLVLDALNPKAGEREGAWDDDAQVVDARVVKADRVRGGEEATVVTVGWEERWNPTR